MISLIRQDNFSKTLWLAGTSSDTKPVDVFNYKGAILPVVNGSAYLEVDTSTYYVFDAENGEWVEQSSGGGAEPEGSIEITANGTYNVKRKAQAVVNVPNDVASFIEATPAVMDNDDVTTVKDYAFYYAFNLKGVNFKNAAHIGSYSFNNCYNLETVSAPKCKVIGNYAFSLCQKLASCPFEEVESLGECAFTGCKLLTDVKFKKLNSDVGVAAFNQCASLVSADLGDATGIGQYVFRYCHNLATLILRKTDAICTLGHVSAFQGTAIQEGNGFIYVPREGGLIDTYKSATNWSIYAEYFRALEDYTVDGTTTGDLDPSKI